MPSSPPFSSVGAEPSGFSSSAKALAAMPAVAIAAAAMPAPAMKLLRLTLVLMGPPCVFWPLGVLDRLHDVITVA